MKTNPFQSSPRALSVLSVIILPVAVTLAAPPKITPTRQLQSKTVFASTTNSFRVTATGDAPLSYEWRQDGITLDGQTTNTLRLENIQASHEGDYGRHHQCRRRGDQRAGPVERSCGHVVDQGQHTNTAGVRLPQLYSLPHTLVPDHKYPLVFAFPGEPIDESSFLSTMASFPTFLHNLSASYRQQETDPAVVVYPTRRSGTSWNAAYASLTSEFLDQIPTLFNTDTNRIYLEGYSGGYHKAWDLLAARPGMFASAQMGGSEEICQLHAPSAIPDIPIWMVTSQGSWDLSTTRSEVQRLAPPAQPDLHRIPAWIAH